MLLIASKSSRQTHWFSSSSVSLSKWVRITFFRSKTVQGLFHLPHTVPVCVSVYVCCFAVQFNPSWEDGFFCFVLGCFFAVWTRSPLSSLEKVHDWDDLYRAFHFLFFLILNYCKLTFWTKLFFTKLTKQPEILSKVEYEFRWVLSQPPCGF